MEDGRGQGYNKDGSSYYGTFQGMPQPVPPSQAPYYNQQGGYQPVTGICFCAYIPSFNCCRFLCDSALHLLVLKNPSVPGLHMSICHSYESLIHINLWLASSLSHFQTALKRFMYVVSCSSLGL